MSMEPSSIPVASQWRLNRQVGIALFVTMILQASMALLWAGGAAERITQLESNAIQQSDLSERMAKMEAHMVQTRESLSRIEDRLNDKS